MAEATTTRHELDLSLAILAKTDLGREEIRTRALRLAPMQRQLLILADGQRDVQALAHMLPGQDVMAAVRHLLSVGCVQAVMPAEAPAGAARSASGHRSTSAQTHADSVSHAQDSAQPSTLTPVEDPLASLPPPDSRSRAQIEMARNFMINTINTLLEQNSRLTLVKHIFDSPDAAALRLHFHDWETAIASSWMGKKRLPELRKKLFAVL
jgi:hypothetical protein